MLVQRHIYLEKEDVQALSAELARVDEEISQLIADITPLVYVPHVHTHPDHDADDKSATLVVKTAVATLHRDRFNAINWAIYDEKYRDIPKAHSGDERLSMIYIRVTEEHQEMVQEIGQAIHDAGHHIFRMKHGEAYSEKVISTVAVLYTVDLLKKDQKETES